MKMQNLNCKNFSIYGEIGAELKQGKLIIYPN